MTEPHDAAMWRVRAGEWRGQEARSQRRQSRATSGHGGEEGVMVPRSNETLGLRPFDGEERDTRVEVEEQCANSGEWSSRFEAGAVVALGHSLWCNTHVLFLLTTGPNVLPLSHRHHPLPCLSSIPHTHIPCHNRCFLYPDSHILGLYTCMAVYD